ncbi:hypothetical protein KCU91_g95, partial [Aureobasidium melanogenum]
MERLFLLSTTIDRQQPTLLELQIYSRPSRIRDEATRDNHSDRQSGPKTCVQRQYSRVGRNIDFQKADDMATRLQPQASRLSSTVFKTLRNFSIVAA